MLTSILIDNPRRPFFLVLDYDCLYEILFDGSNWEIRVLFLF